MPYFLPEGYIERLGAPQDFDAKGGDEWQNEVYQTALLLAEVLGLETVMDFGCGSGFKLMKYFAKFKTVGVDLPEALPRLQQKYPDRHWCASDFGVAQGGIDLLICSDVIEHVDEPDGFLALLKNFHPQWLVISTPDRKLMARYPRWTKTGGPPGNGCHAREWSFEEFRKYMDVHCEVIRHFHSNREQATQCVIARFR